MDVRQAVLTDEIASDLESIRATYGGGRGQRILTGDDQANARAQLLALHVRLAADRIAAAVRDVERAIRSRP